MAEFGYEIGMDVRFRDIDAMGHVNNAVYSTYLEQARIDYLRDVVGADLEEMGVVIADLHVDFERPIEYGEAITVGIRAGEPGTSSFGVDHEIRADGDRAATAEATLVTFDPEAGESVPIPEEWRERIRAHEGH